MRRFILVLAGLCLPASALAASQQPIEPIEVPPSVEQGLDMVYIDREIAPSMEQRDAQLEQQGFERFPGRAGSTCSRRCTRSTPICAAGWSSTRCAGATCRRCRSRRGPVLKLNSTGDRVALLRQRLGLAEGTKFDAATAAAVKEFQGAHGMKADGVAGAGTIDALNRGFKHYENVLMLNLERAPRASAHDRERPLRPRRCRARRGCGCSRTAARSTACGSSSARRRPRRR